MTPHLSKKITWTLFLMICSVAFGQGVRERRSEQEIAKIVDIAAEANKRVRTVNDSLRHELALRPRNLKVERDSLVAKTAREMGLNPALAIAISWVENPEADSTAISYAGAVGLMQVMPPEALAARGENEGAASRREMIKRICGRATLVERACNVRVGLSIYADYLARYGDEHLALAAYNGALRLPDAAERYVSAVRAAVRAAEAS